MVPSARLEIGPKSILVEGGFTVRPTSRAVAKAGQSDPVVECGIAIA